MSKKIVRDIICEDGIGLTVYQIAKIQKLPIKKIKEVIREYYKAKGKNYEGMED